MSFLTVKRKILPTNILSFIYRKYFEISLSIALTVLLCVFLSTQFFNTYHNRSYNTTANVSQLIQIENLKSKLPLENIVKHETTELPLKIKLKTILNCRNRQLQMERLQYGEYWLIKNYIRGSKSINMGCGESITYTTNGDFTFMENLPKVVERWSGPVSFALYTPGDDYATTMNSIQYVRNCLPESDFIRDYVTFHIYFPKEHLPHLVAKTEDEALQWAYDCKIQAPYLSVSRNEMYKTKKNLTYPINVGRNIARKTVNTYFILACDIELYPSLGLINQFLEMVLRNASLVLESAKPKVFVLPVFEIEKNVPVPDTKKELQSMLKKSLAVHFHKYVCANCHMVPEQKLWVEANDSDTLEVFTVGKRYGKYVYWEPFYISDNKEPIFDERVTWEGQSNKRIQNYAMCLLDYEYHVLHPAFLVHSPGIKKFQQNSTETKTRMCYVKAMNNIIFNEIVPEYKVLYGTNKRCDV